MASSNDALRRRAAWAVLSPVLGEDALIDALWLQHESMRGEAVSDLIAYIDAVAARHLLDAATRKRLYGAYFEALRQAEDQLPMDPWPMMQARRPAAAAAAPRPVAVSTPAPVVMPPPVPAMAVAVATPSAPALAPETPLVAAPQPAHEAVFSALVGAMFAGVRQFHGEAVEDLRSACRARLDRAAVPAPQRQRVRDILSAPGLETWQVAGDAGPLSMLAHEVYVALCETLGPVDADQVLMQAVRRAEQLPQAREFPPSRLL